MTLTILITLVLIGVVVACAVFLLSTGAIEKQVVRDSLSQLDDYDLSHLDPEFDPRSELLSKSTASRVLLPAIRQLTEIGRNVSPDQYKAQVRQKFVYAGRGSADDVDRFMAAKVVLTPSGVLIGLFMLITQPFPMGGFLVNLVAAGAVGAIIALGADLWLNRKMESRQLAISRSLPDVMDLLTISVEAGLSFEQGLDRVVREVRGPLSDEAFRMLGEARSGSSRSDAIRAMEARCGIPELRSFVLAVIQADQFGVSIGRVLRAQSDELRIRRRQLANEMAQKAPVKMLFPMVFCIFPSLFIVIIGPAFIRMAGAGLT